MPQPDAEGDVHLSLDAVRRFYAQDLPAAHIGVLAATQRKIRSAAFETPLTTAAWRRKTCWFLVASRDRVIDPRLQFAMASRMKAHWSFVDSSHVAPISRPSETTRLILESMAALR